jgi:hypothetical protein
MLKSIATVIGSYLLSVVLVLGTDPVLSRIFPGEFDRGHIPSTNPLIASTVCFAVIAVICALVCARFAPSSPGKHVLWFFVLGEVMGIAAIIPGWNKGWPHWYGISWLIIWPIACWIGLKIATHRTA